MGPGGEWLTGWASAKPFPGKDTRTLTSDRVVFSRYNLGRHLRGSQVPQKKRKARINVQFPRLDALLVSAVIRVNAEGRKLTLKGLILRKQAQALLLVLTHPAPNHLPHFTEQRNDLPAQHCHGLTEICDSRAQARFTTLTTLSAKKKKKSINRWGFCHISYCYLCVRAKVLQSCPILSNPRDCSPPGSPVHGDSPGKSTAVGCRALLFQGIFPTQGLNPLPYVSLAGGIFTSSTTWEN